MNGYGQRIFRFSPLAGLVAAVALVFLAAAILFAQTPTPRPEAGVAREAQDAPDVPDTEATPGTITPAKIPPPIDAPSPPDDSIYVEEITIDCTGITIRDREGRVYSLATQDTAVEFRERTKYYDKDRKDLIHVVTDKVTIDLNETITGDVVCVFGGDIDVQGKVEGMVFTLFGNINVDGEVGNAAVAPFGGVRVGGNGKVAGDVVASNIDKEPGGRIGGFRNELFFNFLGDTWEPRGAHWAQTTLTVIVLLKVLFWVFLVLLAHALAARNVAKVKAKIQMSFFKSFIVGILTQILFLPLLLLLIMTIIGIPVAVFLIPLMIVAAVILSQAAIGLYLGEKIDENTNLKFATPLGKTLAGLLALQSVPLLSVAFAWGTGSSLLGGSFRVLAFSTIVLSMLLGYVVVTLGTGAVVMTRFGTRPKDPKPDGEEPVPEVNDGKHPHATPLPRRQADESGTATATS